MGSVDGRANTERFEALVERIGTLEWYVQTHETGGGR
jgi:hypothetical protein